MSLRATGRPRLGSTWAQRYCMWKLLLGTWPVAAAVPAEICGCQLLSSLQMFRVVVYHSELTHSPTSSAIFCHYIPQSHWYKWLKLTFYTCLTSSNRYFSGVREIFYNVTLKLITKQQYLMLQRALKSGYFISLEIVFFSTKVTAMESLCRLSPTPTHNSSRKN